MHISNCITNVTNVLISIRITDMMDTHLIQCFKGYPVLVAQVYLPSHIYENGK
jgi:hypothetical protein